MERRLSILLIRVLLVLGFLSGVFSSAYAQGSLSLQRVGVDKIKASWSSVNNANGYHLEWTFVNSYGGGTPSVDFRNGATRVETTKTSYLIPAIYENGYLYVRVRSFSKSGSGRIITGMWYNASPISVTSNDQDNLNWQAVVDYSEEGKNKEVMTYYDGTMRARQMVTRNSSDDVIVGETFYDHRGRAAVQTLPVPTLEDDDSISYHHKFNVYKNGNKTLPYDLNAFEPANGNPCGMVAKEMSNTSGSSRYYSSSNKHASGAIDKYIPDANGYPFSQTEYTPDNTGRIRRQGGVGEQYQLGTGDSTHPTLYYYGKPTQEDLWKLFGSQCGDFSHYQKNMTIDPNGSIYVTYVDMNGRTIATALAGNSPSSLDSIDSRGGCKTMNVNLLNQKSDSISGTDMSSSTPFLASSPGTYNFIYSDTLKNFNIGNGRVCLNCKYLLKINIINDCGDSVPLRWGKDTINSINIPMSGEDIVSNGNCSGDTAFRVSFSASLNSIGRYYINRYLMVDAKEKREKIDSVIPTIVPSVNDRINDKKMVAVYAKCGVESDCSSQCAMEHPNDRDAYVLCLAECKNIMDETNSCTSQKDIMISDFIPGKLMTDSVKGDSALLDAPQRQVAGGQYAAYTIKNDSFIGLEYTIFEEENFKKLLDDEDFKKIVNKDSIPMDSISTIQSFVKHFKTEWAEFLAKKYHPEWKMDVDCKAEKIFMFYPRLMYEVDSYDQAVRMGLFYPCYTSSSIMNNILSSLAATADTDKVVLDTFVINRKDLRNNLRNKLEEVKKQDGKSLDMWQISLYTSVLDDNPSFNDSVLLEVVQNIKAPVYAFDVNGCPFDTLGVSVDWDNVWYTFRSLYLNQRRLEYEKFKNEQNNKKGLNTLLFDKQNVDLKEIGMAVRIPSYGENETDANEYMEDESKRDSLSSKVKDMQWTNCLKQAKAQSYVIFNEMKGCLNSWRVDMDPGLNSKREDTVRNEMVRILAYSSYRSGQTFGYNSIPPELAHYRDSSYVDKDSIDPVDMARFEPNYYSVESLLSHYFNLTDSCNLYLSASLMLSYGEEDPDASFKPLDACGCDLIIEMADSFRKENIHPNRVYKSRVYASDDTTGYTLRNFNAMLCLCKSEWDKDQGWTTEAVNRLRNSGYSIPAELTCDECVACDTISNALNRYAIQSLFSHPLTFYSLHRSRREDWFDDNHKKLVTNYLNSQLHMSNTFEEYCDFSARCDSVANGHAITEYTLTAESDLIFEFINDIARNHVLTDTISDSRIYSSYSKLLESRGKTGTGECGNVGPGIYPYAYIKRTEKTNVSTEAICTDKCGTAVVSQKSDTTFSFKIESGTTTASLEFEKKAGLDLSHVHEVKDMFYDPGISRVRLVVTVGAEKGTYMDTISIIHSDWNLVNCKTIESLSDLKTCVSDGRKVDRVKDECAEELMKNIIYQAENEYWEDYDTTYAMLSNEYISACYGGLSSEKLNMSYVEREHHYTLYYYDQAGNLVRTVPPAGVEFVDVDKNRAALKKDLKKGTQSVFTNHRLETRYVYNSLNQLVYQYMPDHDPLDVKYKTKNIVNDKNMVLSDVAFGDSKEGISAVVDTVNHSTNLYVTHDNGGSWSQVSYSEIKNLNDVKTFPSGGFTLAGGDGGALLKKDASSDRWTVKSSGITNDIVSILGNRTPIIYTDNGKAYTSDAKVENVKSNKKFDVQVQNLWDVDMSSKFAVAVGKQNDKPVVYYASVSGDAIGSWNVSNVILGKMSSIAMDDKIGYASGENGLLMKTTDKGNSWSVIPSIGSEPYMEMCMVGSDRLFALKSSGDLYELDLSTHTSRRITSNVKHISGGDRLYFLKEDGGKLTLYKGGTGQEKTKIIDLPVSSVVDFAVLGSDSKLDVYYINASNGLVKMDVRKEDKKYKNDGQQIDSKVSDVKRIVASSDGKLYMRVKDALHIYEGQGKSVILSVENDDVWGVSAGGRFIVAHDNQLIYAENNSYKVSSIQLNRLNAVGVNDKKALIVGDKGVVLYSSNVQSQVFKLLPAVAAVNLLSVDYANINKKEYAIVGGVNGTLLSFNSSRERFDKYSIPNSPTEDITAVRLHSNASLFLGTKSKSVIWVSLSGPTNNGSEKVSFGVNAIDCTNDKVWMVGDDGGVIESDYKK